MVDILFDQSKDRVVVNIECEASLLNDEQVNMVVERWKEELRRITTQVEID